jgi:hypothetical protein
MQIEKKPEIYNQWQKKVALIRTHQSFHIAIRLVQHQSTANNLNTHYIMMESTQTTECLKHNATVHKEKLHVQLAQKRWSDKPHFCT